MDDNPILEQEHVELTAMWLEHQRNERLMNPGMVGELPEDFEEIEAVVKVHST